MTEPDVTAPVITVEDLRQKAIRIADSAEAEVRAITAQPVSTIAVVGVIAVAAALSFAYFLGTRRR